MHLVVILCAEFDDGNAEPDDRRQAGTGVRQAVDEIYLVEDNDRRDVGRPGTRERAAKQVFGKRRHDRYDDQQLIDVRGKLLAARFVGPVKQVPARQDLLECAFGSALAQDFDLIPDCGVSLLAARIAAQQGAIGKLDRAVPPVGGDDAAGCAIRHWASRWRIRIAAGGWLS